MKKLLFGLFTTILLIVILPVNNFSQETKPPTIVSSYSAVIPVGEKFEYKIEVVAEPTITLEFQLLRGPEGMLIDSKTGVVTWTPKTAGEFSAEIVIYSVKNSTTKTKVGGTVLKLKVVDFKGIISGYVKNNEGKEIAKAVVILYKKNTAANKEAISYLNSTMTDASGKYSLSVYEEGTYYIQASYKNESIPWNTEPTYLPVWYKDAVSAEKAEGIPITKAAPKFTADITMQKNPNQYVVTLNYGETVVKNQEFKYQVSLPISANSQPVEYKLTKALIGMTLDAQTGIVKWTPTEKGEFSAEVGVFLKSTNTQIAKVVIKLNVVEFLGSLSGIVKNEAGEALNQILVTLYRKMAVSEKSSVYVTSLSALTNEKGEYIITKIEPGTYYAYARPSESKTISTLPNPNLIYMPVWYKDSPTMENADVIVIAQTLVKVDANFTMHKYVKVEPKVYTLSGKVTDAVTSKAIANATVFVSIAPKVNVNGASANGTALGIASVTCSDPSFGLFTDVVYKTVTDIEGNYKLSVKEGTSYIIACFAENYLLLYYDNKSNVAEATKLTPTKDETGINFKLTPAPQAKAKVSGKVVDEANAAVASKVILYSSPISSVAKPTARSVSTNANGEFVFEKVPNGTYYVQVYPVKDYMPAYYKSGGCGIKEAKEASIVTVANDANVNGINVCVKKITTTGGGKISGMIMEPDGKAIAGVTVTAESKDQSDVAYAITESDGSFVIDGLGVGDYTLTGEKFGYNTIVKDGATIDYTKNVFNSNVNLVMSQNSVTDVDDEQIIPSDYNLFQNYPNPFNPTTVIKFALPQAERVTLKIYDILGNETATLINSNLSAGTHQVTFNASGLPSGFYVYRIITANYSAVKKMLLIK